MYKKTPELRQLLPRRPFTQYWADARVFDWGLYWRRNWGSLSAKDVGTIFFIVSSFAAIGGYAANIFKLIYLAMEVNPPMFMAILRVIGIPFFPLGIILGYF